MKILALAAAVAALAACGRKPSESPTGAAAPAAAPNLTDYIAEDASFTCRAPGDWKALEGTDGGPIVMFFGPADGPARNKTTISIGRWPGRGPGKTPADFRAALRLAGFDASELETRALDGGATAYALHYLVPHRRAESRQAAGTDREDAVLIPAKDGFFEITHSAPAESYRDTWPAFEAVLSSFRAKS